MERKALTANSGEDAAAYLEHGIKLIFDAGMPEE